MILKVNGQQIVNEVYTASTVNDVPWWVLPSPTDLISENFKEDAAEFFIEVIVEFLKALAVVVVDLSYSIALLGGGILLIVKVVTGFEKTGQWLSLLLLVHFLIQFILG